MNTENCFCICCLSTNDLFDVCKPYKEDSAETFLNLIHKTFSFEKYQFEAVYAKYLCLRCSHKLIDAYTFKLELKLTLVLLDEQAKESYELEDKEIDQVHSPEFDEICENDFDESKDVIECSDNEKKAAERYRRSYLKQLNLDKEQTICPVCGKNLFWPMALRCHIRQEHSRRIKCDICDRSFAWKSSLNRHRLTHNPQLKKHLKNRQNQFKKRKPKSEIKPRDKYKEPTPYKLEPNQTVCEICKGEFTLPRLLRIHMHEHFPLHVCEQCGRGYATKQSLRKHKTSHESGPHTCPHCGKVFDLLNTLASHIRCRHSGTSLHFPCPLCHERFSTSLKRVNHRMTVHGEDIKVYHCPHCPRIFKVYVHMSTHIKSRHVSEDKKTCGVCSKQFSEVKNLGRHMRKVHKATLTARELTQGSYTHNKVHGYQ